MATQTKLKVEGMSCQTCVRHVREALEPLAGVTRVQVQLEPGQAEIEHDTARVSVEDLVQALRDAGYDASAA